VLAALTLAASWCGSASGARFVVDQTLSCAVSRDGSGTFVFRLAGRAGTERSGLAFAGISVGHTTAFRSDTRLGWAGVEGARGFYVNRDVCRPTPIVVPLSRKGLPGAATPSLPATATCLANPGARLLVRVRATLEGIPNQTGPRPFVARGKVVSAAVAVQLERRRTPVGYASLSEGARTLRFFAPNRCRIQHA
jgi:hypothetical protein